MGSEGKVVVGAKYHSETAPKLSAFAGRVKEGGVALLLDEFRDLRKTAREQDQASTLTTAAFEANPARNRFKDVGCWDQTRVTLRRAQDYIHASWVDGALRSRQFICTQGPLDEVAGATDSTIGDFWDMVWEEKVGVIAMLCRTEEAGRTKCAHYWPERHGERRQAGPVSVEAKDVDVRRIGDHEVVVTSLELLKDGYTNTRNVLHFYHKSWPDQRCPSTAYGLAEFIIRCHTALKRVADNNDDVAEESPLLVHCSSGIGRSGTFLGIDIALGILARWGTLDIKRIVRLLRTQRLYAVQTPIQYVLIYQAILEFLVKHKNVSFDVEHFAKEAMRIKNA